MRASSSLLCRSARPPIPRLLLGPPELRLHDTTTVPPPPPSNPFIDLMVTHFNNLSAGPPPPPPMGFTENNSPTFLSSGNPCLDFFFHVVPDTPPETLLSRLSLAWAHNPLTALKLVCNLRGVRGTGKSDREGFYTAALWLHRHHPKTLASNVASFADFGYFKDLPEILYRLLEGPEVRSLQRAEWAQRKGQATRCVSYRQGKPRFYYISTRPKNKKPKNNDYRVTVPREIRVSRALERGKIEKEEARALRKEKLLTAAKKALLRYQTDQDFRFLHDKVSDHLAECLLSDLRELSGGGGGGAKKISLAAKWCPSLSSSFDRSTLLCESVAKQLFPRESSPEYKSLDEAHYAFRVRDRLRKEVLVRLRKVMELPEVYMSANLWGSIPYNRVASVAMRNNKRNFLRHDHNRFTAYLARVRAGESTIAAGALLPHQIVSAVRYDVDDGGVAELQWRRMVADVAATGKMRNCIAVCDVSGSMRGVPMDVSVALGLLVSELSEEPWKGKIITFSRNPELQVIAGDDLRTKVGFVESMKWGMNTDFQKVFDLILEVAVRGNLREEDMIKRIFVFSDMEFDEANSSSSGKAWETDYSAIIRKFEERGYGGSVPQVVFWNLRDSRSTPVCGTQKGVALVSGFSKNLMKLFLEDGGDMEDFSPETTMELALSGDEYQRLVVLD